MNVMDDKTALLVMDMIHDFVDSDGALYVPDAGGIVPAISSLIKEAREAGATVVFINDSHDAGDKEFEIWPEHAITGTKGAQVIDDIALFDSDHVIEKKRYSGFYGTTLESILEEYSISRIVITGTVTNICVMTTAFDAAARDYEVVVFKDAVAGLDKDDHEFALRQIDKVIGGTVI